MSDLWFWRVEGTLALVILALWVPWSRATIGALVMAIWLSFDRDFRECRGELWRAVWTHRFGPVDIEAVCTESFNRELSKMFGWLKGGRP